MKRRQKNPVVLLLRLVSVVGGVYTALSFVLVHILEVKDLGSGFEHFVPRRHLQPTTASLQEPLLFEDWPHPFIHIINTRFQQEQANLTALGQARLVLFETFCVKSILGQTILLQDEQAYGTASLTPPFLWIIKIDPHLSDDLLRDLIGLVANYHFVYVVASNINFGVGQRVGGWRDGQAGEDVLLSKVYTGNLTLLRQAHSARESRAVLETRVDADDGLHHDYIAVLQQEASKKLVWQTNQTNPDRQRWLYWCALNHADWSPTPSELFTGNGHLNQQFGMFVAKKSAHVCITAGITLGVSIGVQEDQIPHYMHHQLVQQLRYQPSKSKLVDCGAASADKCLHLMSHPYPAAIRSRTPTSAGMRGVVSDEAMFEQQLQDEPSASVLNRNATILALLLRVQFNVYLDEVVEANQYFQDHLVDITTDNLRGQCTRGHSCKVSTKEALQKLLDLHSSSNTAATQR